jgi:hypothetical protein
MYLQYLSNQPQNKGPRTEQTKKKESFSFSPEDTNVDGIDFSILLDRFHYPMIVNKRLPICVPG